MRIRAQQKKEALKMLKEPECADELVYLTRRIIDGCAIVAWVKKQLCPKCKEALMGKPVDSKGHVKIRAKEYQCPKCGYTAEKGAYEGTLAAEINYTCPNCKFSGDVSIPFVRKKIKVVNEETGKQATVDALCFTCAKCQKRIDITKKMK